MNPRKPTDLGPVARLYSESLAEHGTSSMGVGWRDDKSHLLRFEKLAEVLDDQDKRLPFSVNDLGCGYGALYGFLVDRGFRISQFRGYDISETMLEQAQRLVPQGEFISGSRLDRVADYSFASGIFNVRLGEDEKSWLGHIERTVANLNEFSATGFAFNLLSVYVDYRASHLFYGDPLHFFDFCKRRFSPRVSLFHDYPLYEWTIVVRK
jgi:SAM-dependent methyltransferase